MSTAPEARTGAAALRCPLCGGFNQCTPAQTGSLEGDCWCRTVRIEPHRLARIPAEWTGKACLCPACAGRVQGLEDGPP